MSCREDYYKFTYLLLPNLSYKQGRLMVYRAMRNKETFIENLKNIWEGIDLKKPQLKNTPPNFRVDCVQLNPEHAGIIISIPEASGDGEANYVGAVYDSNDKFRYFTYEIGVNENHSKIYYLCELDEAGNRSVYGTQNENTKSAFLRELSSILIYDLF